LLYFGDDDGYVAHILDIHTTTVLNTISFRNNLAFPPIATEYLGGEALAVTCLWNTNPEMWGSELFILDIETSQIIKMIPTLQKATTLKYLGGDLILCVGKSGLIFVMDVTNGRVVQKLRSYPSAQRLNCRNFISLSPERRCWQVEQADSTPAPTNVININETQTSSNETCIIS
jgi:hypothetical protein